MLATIGLILCRLVYQRLHSACHACQGHGAISQQQQAVLTSCCDCILPALVSSSCCCSQCPDVVWGLQGWMHCILYVLFENAMGIVKLGAVVAGEGPHSPATLPETCGLIHHPCLHAAVCHHDHVQPHALHPQTTCMSASACCHQYWAQDLQQHLLQAHERAKDAAVLAGPVLAPRALILCCAVGMLDLQKAQEWVVTTKLGSSDKRPGTSAAPPRDCRFYAGEMAMSTFVLTAAFYGIFSINRWSFSIFLTLQGVPRPSSSCSCPQNLAGYGMPGPVGCAHPEHDSWPERKLHLPMLMLCPRGCAIVIAEGASADCTSHKGLSDLKFSQQTRCMWLHIKPDHQGLHGISMQHHRFSCSRGSRQELPAAACTAHRAAPSSPWC